MLAELLIRNFAIIDELTIAFQPGLNVLTGETGAGKSIILDAMALVLGERADTTMVRSGDEEAYVEAAFDLSDSIRQGIEPILEQEGLEGDQTGLLTLARQLRVNGRNICRVNGRAVSLSILRDIGDRLVDIHGQGEHLSLLRPRSHLFLLDAYAGTSRARQEVASKVTELRSVRNELSRLRDDQRSAEQRADMLAYQIEEIRAAKLTEGEEEELRVERTRLGNVEQLIADSSSALAALNGLNDVGEAAVDLVGKAERALDRLVRLDATLSGSLERLQGLSFQLSEIVAELMDYQENLEFSPGRLEFIEERLELIGRLKRKYGDTAGEILAWRDRAEKELEGISHSEQRAEELSSMEEALLHELGQMGVALSDARAAAARSLEADVERELSELRMDRAQFRVDMRQVEDESGAYAAGRRLAFDESGLDRIEFLISANPGEELKPMARVASGGETSRLMLALKTALARIDDTPTLIFDEIDQGIGGRVGDVVGRKLWSLTSGARHQVIVVTHLPQLAGYADGHYHVGKSLSDGRVTTSVEWLEIAGRIEELAAMLGTQGEHATGGARSILEQVEAVKGAQ
jgi:DNA repair protein RecN (Recombination protein N)